MSRLIRLALVATVLVSAPSLALADIVLSAVDSGFVTMAGGSSKGDGTIFAPATYNYSVGYELHYATGALVPDLAPMDRNNVVPAPRAL